MILSAQNLTIILIVLGGIGTIAGIAIIIRHLVNREKKIAETEKKAIANYKDIIDNANKKASEILQKTTSLSENILLQTKNTNENVSENLDKILQEMAEKHIKSLAGEVVTFRKEYEDKIMQMQQAVDQNTKFVIQNTQYNLNKNLEQFSKTMLEKTSTAAQVLDEKAKTLLVQAEKDIAVYKEAEIKKIDKAILQLVQKTYQDVLGANIPPEINRETILKALEKSKKEGLFDI